jgi:glutathione S-transferase
MYKLYYAPGAASMAPHATMIEVGKPPELVLVDVDKGEQHHPDYLELNPHARVPTFIDGDLVMYESAAITLLLCERHPEAGLAPAPGEPDRPRFLQWLFYLTNTVQEELMHHWHPDNYVDDAAAQKALFAGVEPRLDRMWQHLDGVLADGPYLLGRRFSVADYYLCMLLRWSRNMPRPGFRYAKLGRLYDLVRARPAMKELYRTEGIA